MLSASHPDLYDSCTSRYFNVGGVLWWDKFQLQKEEANTNASIRL